MGDCLWGTRDGLVVESALCLHSRLLGNIYCESGSNFKLMLFAYNKNEVKEKIEILIEGRPQRPKNLRAIKFKNYIGEVAWRCIL